MTDALTAIPPATAFPGAIHDVGGNILDEPRPWLEQADLDAFPHLSLVTDRDGAPVARIWLLDDDATPTAIPPIVTHEAMQLVLSGRGVIVLGRRPKPKASG